MYEYWLDPPKFEIIEHCSECGEDLFIGEYVWKIKNNLFCECCINSFREEIEEREFEYEQTI